MNDVRHWTAESMAGGEAHLVRVAASDVATLARDLPTAFDPPRSVEPPRDNGKDGDEGKDLTAVLEGLAARILHQTCRGPGLAIVGGDDLGELTDGQLTCLLYRLSLLLGHPMSQNPAGDRVVSVRDEQPSDPGARGYRTNKRLLMHTDAADVAGLLCLSPGSAGGSNTFASAETIHDVLIDESPELVPEYYRRWEWDLRGLQRSGERPTLSAPVYSYYGGRLRCRYASLLLRNGAARAGTELSPAQVQALDRFEEVAHRPALHVRHTLRRGESMWMDNYLVLHGREPFDDDAGRGRVRHLLRTWIWLHDAPVLAPGFGSPREIY